jgi:hypothetical protein
MTECDIDVTLRTGGDEHIGRFPDDCPVAGFLKNDGEADNPATECAPEYRTVQPVIMP